VFIKVDLELLKSRETRLHHEVVNRPHDVGADLGGRRSHFCESLQVLLNVELISTMKSYRGDIRFVNFFRLYEDVWQIFHKMVQVQCTEKHLEN